MTDLAARGPLFSGIFIDGFDIQGHFRRAMHVQLDIVANQAITPTVTSTMESYALQLHRSVALVVRLGISV
jgi:hypothetical protein